jgi:hypothetical protein
MIANKDVYATLTQMIVQVENISWNRFYNFLMGSSILVLAWGTLYASDHKGWYVKLVLVLLCLVGCASGPPWAKMGVRARNHLEVLFEMACALESHHAVWEPDVRMSDRPFSAIAPARKEAEWYSKNVFILRAVPWAFSILNLSMLLASIVR